MANIRNAIRKLELVSSVLSDTSDKKRLSELSELKTEVNAAIEILEDFSKTVKNSPYDYTSKHRIYEDMIAILSDYENCDGLPVGKEDLYSMLNIIATRWNDLIIVDNE